MKVMVLVKASPASEAGEMPGTELLTEMGRFNEALLKAGILLSPNEFFMLRAPETVWFRFNVAYTDTPVLQAFLQSIRPR